MRSRLAITDLVPTRPDRFPRLPFSCSRPEPTSPFLRRRDPRL